MCRSALGARQLSCESRAAALNALSVGFGHAQRQALHVVGLVGDVASPERVTSAVPAATADKLGELVDPRDGRGGVATPERLVQVHVDGRALAERVGVLAFAPRDPASTVCMYFV